MFANIVTVVRAIYAASGDILAVLTEISKLAN